MRKFMKAVMALIGCVALGGHAAEPAATGPSLYERLGGEKAITAVVEETIANLSADARINGRFQNASIGHLQRNLVDLVCVRSGGPCTYRGKSMADAHEGMHIRDDEFDALVEDVAKALDKLKVPAAETGEVLTIMRQMKGAIVDH